MLKHCFRALAFYRVRNFHYLIFILHKYQPDDHLLHYSWKQIQHLIFSLTFNEWGCISSQIPEGPGEPGRVDIFDGVGIAKARDSDADAPGTAGRVRLRVIKQPCQL